jgi:hypothetical protein
MRNQVTSSACLTILATVAAGWPLVLNAETRPLSVCEALNSTADHQAVVIHAAIVTYRHGAYIFEGTGQDPCPGWPKRFFTAPAAIPLFLGPFRGVHLPDGMVQGYLDFSRRLRNLQSSSPSVRHMVTISGVIIRKPWPLIFRNTDGTYGGWGEGIDGSSAAMLVVTSVPLEDR